MDDYDETAFEIADAIKRELRTELEVTLTYEQYYLLAYALKRAVRKLGVRIEPDKSKGE